MVPTLETARLRLRAIRSDDLDRWAGILADPAVFRHLGGIDIGREEAVRKLLGSAGSWTIFGFGYWAVEARERPGMIGHVGFADFRREIVPSLAGLPEAGWIFAREAHGQGLAGEAVAAALGWADANLRVAIPAIIDPDNAASIRLAERSGFAPECETRYRDAPILLFRRPAPA